MVMGSVELFVSFIMMFGGGFGFPMGMPPADEMPIMSNIAPEDCTFYATWAGVKTLDPNANPTEKWMAQEQLQTGWLKLKAEIKRLIEQESANSEDNSQIAGAEFMFDFAETILTHAGMVYVSKFDVDADQNFTIEGGMLIHLGSNSARIQQKFLALINAGREENEIKQVSINGIEFNSTENVNSNSNLVWAFRDDFFWAALGEETMEMMLANVETSPPAWLTDIRQRIPVDRIATVSYLNTAKLMPLLDLVDEEEFDNVMNLIGVKDVSSASWIGGLNSNGYVTRTLIDFESREPKGVFGLIHGNPIKPGDLGRVDKDAMLVMSQRLNPERIYKFIFDVADATGGREELEYQIKQFESSTGVDLEDELIDSLDDLVTVYGSFNLLNPASGWVLSVKIKNEMVFQGAIRKLTEFAEQMAESTDGMELKQQKRNGKTIYSIAGIDDLGLSVEPSWCEDGGELVFSLNRSAVSKHVRRDGVDEENNIAFTNPLKQIFDRASESRTGPVAVIQFDFAEVLTLAVSTIRGLVPEDEELIPGSDLRIKDLPTAEVIVNGVQPNIYGVYRTESGFEMFQQQTFPGGSPGVNLGVVAVMAFPVLEAAQTATQRTMAANNLRQSAIALHNYHDVHGALPPAYSTDEDGNPLLSWRVHILPYIEQGELYEEFHLDEPWDSEHNIKLLEKMPPAYRSTSLKLEPGKTTHLAAAGVGAMFNGPIAEQNGKPNPTGVRLVDIRDGTSMTIMLVEGNEMTAVNWTEPKDFDVEAGMFLGRLEGVFPSGNNFAFGDGSVKLIQPRGKEELLKKLFSIGGGESVDWNEIYD